jgi:uncharacterized SAM-binding protein YcdF (DUF218 family)
MPPHRPSFGGSLRRIVLSVCALVLVLALYGFVELGAFLATENPLQKADAIVVLAGSRLQRQLEAADLYLAGYAPRIVLTREIRDPAEVALSERGVEVREQADRIRDIFLQLGIPNDAVVIPAAAHDSTAAEAITVRELSVAHGWRRLLVVSSKYHLRRAGFAFRRELSGTDVEVLMRGTRYDRSDPERWWRHRADLREVGPEALKLVAYVLGLGA